MHKGSPILAVCMALFSLLFTLVSPQCREGTAHECQTHGPLVPGLKYAKHGIDITTLDITRGRLMNLNKWQTASGSCIVCENPFLNHQIQKLPLAITNWTVHTSCQKKVQHSVFESVMSVSKTMTELTVKNDWKTELDVEVKSSANFQRILAGSLSGFTWFTKNRVSQDNYIFLLHHVSCSYYKFKIDKDQSVSKVFQGRVQALPEKYDGMSKQKYHHLIKNFGTHFATDYDLGAAVRILTALPVCKIQLEGVTVSVIRKCLEIEVRYFISFDDAIKDPDFEKCNKTIPELARRWLLDEQLRYIRHSRPNSPFFDIAYGKHPTEWLEDVAKNPHIFSYSLEPLHTLVDKNDPRRESLRQAISEYVRERVLWRNCTPACPSGVQQSSFDSCSCECPNNNFTNSMCCPQQTGLAKLTVFIKNAQGLFGDYFTRSDGYVSVRFKDKVMCTPTVWNNNHPEWNARLDFGIIQLTESYFPEIEIQVWDEDRVQDDLLGTCTISLTPGDPTWHSCYLNNLAHLYYKYFLFCGPHLTGPDCMDYSSSFPF